MYLDLGFLADSAILAERNARKPLRGGNLSRPNPPPSATACEIESDLVLATVACSRCIASGDYSRDPEIQDLIHGSFLVWIGPSLRQCRGQLDTVALSGGEQTGPHRFVEIRASL